MGMSGKINNVLDDEKWSFDLVISQVNRSTQGRKIWQGKSLAMNRVLDSRREMDMVEAVDEINRVYQSKAWLCEGQLINRGRFINQLSSPPFSWFGIRTTPTCRSNPTVTRVRREEMQALGCHNQFLFSIFSDQNPDVIIYAWGEHLLNLSSIFSDLRLITNDKNIYLTIKESLSPEKWQNQLCFLNNIYKKMLRQQQPWRGIPRQLKKRLTATIEGHQ